MKSKITLKDIAKEFGVSTSTVSKALNDSHEISTETKERIKAYAAYYNYKPNSLALKLRNQRTYIIGVIIPQISTDEYFAELALWYGIPKSDLPLLFPNIGNFYNTMSTAPPIGFMDLN